MWYHFQFYFGVNVTCCEPKIDRMILLFKKPVIRHGVSLLGISITYYVGHFTCVIQFEDISENVGPVFVLTLRPVLKDTISFETMN